MLLHSDPGEAGSQAASMIRFGEGAAPADALVVSGRIAADDGGLLHFDAEVLFDKIDRCENREKRISFAAAGPSDLSDLPEGGSRHPVGQRKGLVRQRR